MMNVVSSSTNVLTNRAMTHDDPNLDVYQGMTGDSQPDTEPEPEPEWWSPSRYLCCCTCAAVETRWLLAAAGVLLHAAATTAVLVMGRNAEPLDTPDALHLGLVLCHAGFLLADILVARALCARAGCWPLSHDGFFAVCSLGALAYLAALIGAGTLALSYLTTPPLTTPQRVLLLVDVGVGYGVPAAGFVGLCVGSVLRDLCCHRTVHGATEADGRQLNKMPWATPPSSAPNDHDSSVPPGAAVRVMPPGGAVVDDAA